MPQTKANKTRQAYQTYKHQVRAGKSNLEAHKQKVILIDLVQIGRAKNGLRFTFEITGGLHTLRVLNCGGSTLERNVHTTFVWGK